MPRHPEYLLTFDYIGPHRYSLTFCTESRRPFFIEAAVVELVLSHFLQQAGSEGFALLAYCFMPDHVHLLVEGLRDTSDGKRFISRAKQFSGFYYAKQFGSKLWQRYGYERVLRNDEATLDVVRYIVANPVRAGLVRDLRDFPFVGSSVTPLSELIEYVRM
jgi:putative transposase